MFIFCLGISILLSVSYLRNISLAMPNGRRSKFTFKEAVEAPDSNKEAFDDMAVYLRMTASNDRLIKFYDHILVQCLRYFWPDIHMVVVLDKEKSGDHEYGDTIRNMFPFPKICYMAEPTFQGYSGVHRMERDMFYSEKCTSKKYVAFVDTDSMFITRIVPEMLFNSGKPIIIAVYGMAEKEHWAQSTTRIFKTKEALTCMSNFPIIFKIEHLVKLRLYLEKLHDLPFDEILLNLGAATFSQFNLMCQYIWMFHRNEYDFHVQLQRMQGPLTYRVHPDIIDSMTTEQQRSPIARVCAHYKYVDKNTTYKDLFKSSVCFAGGFDVCPHECKAYNSSALRKEMFVLDYGVDWTWDSRCLAAQVRHYELVAKYKSPDYLEIIRKACSQLDTLTSTF